MEHPVPPRGPLPPSAMAALHAGKVIEAIKLVRQEEGLGLKEAKDRVEQCIAGDPLLKEKFAAVQVQGQRGCLLGLAVLAVLGALLYFFFRAS